MKECKKKRQKNKKKKLPKELLTDDKFLIPILKKINFNSLEDAYENIGFGSISQVKIINRINEAYKEINKPQKEDVVIKQNKSKKKEESNLVIVENIPNCKVKYARCCMPIPGDDIVGYITFSNGVSIHRKDCKNLTIK